MSATQSLRRKSSPSKGSLTILGELVHNPIVRERLRTPGIREAALENVQPASAQVMITAHGASDAKRAEWRAAGVKIADGTCPLVRHAHNELKRLVAAPAFFPLSSANLDTWKSWDSSAIFPEALVLNSPEDVSACQVALAMELFRKQPNR